MWTLEQVNILKIVDEQAILCTDESLLSKVYRAGGRPGKPVKRELIHWIPYRIKWDGQPINYDY